MHNKVNISYVFSILDFEYIILDSRPAIDWLD